MLINFICVNKKRRVQHLDRSLAFGIGVNDVITTSPRYIVIQERLFIRPN